MLIMDAVLETYEARGFTLWPISDPADDRLLRLSGDLSPRQVGTAMAVLTGYNNRPRRRSERHTTDSLAQVNRLLTAECVVAPGGLRVRDTDSGVTVLPGCCFGLENWRDWQVLLEGEDEPWLGHDPGPRAEHVGATVRLWPDAARQEGRPIEIPRDQLRDLLRSVQDDLTGFLKCVERWASCGFAPVAGALVATLDEGFAVSAQLDDSP